MTPKWVSGPLLAAILAVTGCYPMNWARVEPRRFGRHQQVKVWTHGAAVQWYGVVETRDSLSGIPYPLNLNCDSCRVSLLRSNVDSVVAGYPESRGAAIVGWILIPVGLVALFYP